MIKTYKYKIQPNKSKQDYINNILYPEWTRVATILMNLHLNHYYRHNSICITNKIYQPVKTFLTERYKDAINRQVLGMFKSKISNFKNKFVQFVMNTDLPDNTKKDLCLVNKRNLFFTNVDTIGKDYKVEKENIKLARWIFKNFKGRMPSCKTMNMVLQSKISTIENAKNSNNFEIFIKLNKGNKNTRGEYIYIPVIQNKYSDKFKDEFSTSSTLVFNNRKLKEVIFTKEVETVKPVLKDITISFDIGLNILIAVNTGDCYGRSYMKKLKKLDLKLQIIQNELKKQYGKCVKLSEYKEYSNLVKLIRDYSKNEINRILNKIYSKYKPSKIVLEDLDFKGSELRRTTNRLLSRFGLGYIKSKVAQLHIDYGVEVVYVDAAYSSQMCSSCGCVDPRNRKSQSKFECKCCGKKINADINGSRVVEYFFKRFGDSKFYGSQGRSKKRTLLVKDYISNLKVWMGDKRITQVLLNNSYFSEYSLVLREKYSQLSLLS